MTDFFFDFLKDSGRTEVREGEEGRREERGEEGRRMERREDRDGERRGRESSI